MTLYMVVTADKYELPMVVEESAEMFAQKLGRSKEGIFQEISRNKSGKRICTGTVRGYRITKVSVQ